MGRVLRDCKEVAIPFRAGAKRYAALRPRGLQRQRRCTRQGGPFSHVREWPPLNPQENARGSPPRPPTLAVSILKNCSACGIRCGVHGFAMNLCVSLPVATAPYCREARVTLLRRQTACRMRHCCARRIVETGGRRKLGCTSTRWAERQRMIGAEANRIATLTRQRRAIGSAIGKHCSSSSCSLAMAKPFSWGLKGDILFREREYPSLPRAAPQALLSLRL